MSFRPSLAHKARIFKELKTERTPVQREYGADRLRGKPQRVDKAVQLFAALDKGIEHGCRARSRGQPVEFAGDVAPDQILFRMGRGASIENPKRREPCVRGCWQSGRCLMSRRPATARTNAQSPRMTPE